MNAAPRDFDYGPRRSGRMLVWDEAPLVRNAMSRTRFMELLRGLQITAPSHPVTTTELADVVRGAGDGPLPAWADDHDFEAELEALIESHSAVWICGGCDRIVGFVEVPWDDIPESVLVARSEGWLQCPHCADGTVSWWDPQVLTLGDPIGPPESPFGEAPARPPSRVSSPSEQFLESVMRDNYDLFGARDDALTISAEGRERYQALIDERAAARLGPIDVSALGSISLRPGAGAGEVDLIGPHWDRALDIAGPEYRDLGDVAVGVAPAPGLAASAHRGPDGQLAVVVEMGLFEVLPELARWLTRLFDGDVGRLGEAQSMAAIDDLIGNVVRSLTGEGETPRLDYESHDEVQRTRFIADAQICFALLHELGHIVDWARPVRQERQAADPQRRAIEIEARADAWAIGRILENGERWFIPWMQYRSVFWLFEYWSLMSAGLGETRATYCGPRERWDGIEKLIRRGGGRRDLRSLYQEELRKIFDLITSELREPVR